MFTPSQQIEGPGGLLRLRFESPMTLHSAALENSVPVLALTVRTPDRLPHYGWLRLPNQGQPFPSGVYLPELVRVPSGELWVCGGVEVEEKEREVFFPLGQTYVATRSHVASQSKNSLGFHGVNWVRCFDKGYTFDPLDFKKKRITVKLKETPPRSAQLDENGQVHYLSGHRPLLYQNAPLPDLPGGSGGYQLLALTPTLDIVTGVNNRLVRHRLQDGRLSESQTLLQLPRDDHQFYSLWNPSSLGENRYLVRFTFDERNGWALIGPDGLERSRLSANPGHYQDESGRVYPWHDQKLILQSLDAHQGQMLEAYYCVEQPESIWLCVTHLDGHG